MGERLLLTILKCRGSHKMRGKSFKFHKRGGLFSGYSRKLINAPGANSLPYKTNLKNAPLSKLKNLNLIFKNFRTGLLRSLRVKLASKEILWVPWLTGTAWAV